jgi:DNA/RNA-binding domain of Phe-tRNA-synthetase-like protein
MQFSHHPHNWNVHPDLAAGVLFARGVHARAAVDDEVAGFEAQARSRLAAAPESEWPEIQAWRRAFSRMGLKPTQYRCAAESLLRRLRKDEALPRLHPLVDLCNAVSVAFGIPIAAFDLAHVVGDLEVRLASGQEIYQAFSGEQEHPEPGEVIFADDAGQAHARRWTHRQSGLSAVRNSTESVLIVAEAMHGSAAADVHLTINTLVRQLEAIWAVETRACMLTRAAPRFSP